MILGLILLAAGLKQLVAAGHNSTTLVPWFLAVGTGLFFIGSTWFRKTLGINPYQTRFYLAVVLFLSVLIGLYISPLLQLILTSLTVFIVLKRETKQKLH